MEPSSPIALQSTLGPFTTQNLRKKEIRIYLSELVTHTSFSQKRGFPEGNATHCKIDLNKL